MSEVHLVWLFMVIILKKLTEHKEIKGKHIAAVIAIIMILIAVFMAAPVYYCTMYRAHQEVHRQQQV